MGTAVELGSRKLEAVLPLARFFFTHSFRTKRLQGRDQVVFWASKSFQTSCADSPGDQWLKQWRPFRKTPGDTGLQRPAQPARPRKRESALLARGDFARQQFSQRFDQQGLGDSADGFSSAAGSERANSTSRWSRNGTRTSRELAMLIASVSRSRVLDM